MNIIKTVNTLLCAALLASFVVPVHAGMPTPSLKKPDLSKLQRETIKAFEDGGKWFNYNLNKWFLRYPKIGHFFNDTVYKHPTATKVAGVTLLVLYTGGAIYAYKKYCNWRAKKRDQTNEASDAIATKSIA